MSYIYGVAAEKVYLYCEQENGNIYGGIKQMISLVSQSGQTMVNICTWIADSIEDMINAAAMSYARPGSECLVISQDQVTKKWSLKKYVLCPNRRDWALIEENTDATVIGPDG
jgi:hypothetical protein